MAGSSIFIKYGIKSGGAAPFLRRTRNAFGQLQTRTRTAFVGNQLQARTNPCIVSSYSTTCRVNAWPSVFDCSTISCGYSSNYNYGGSCPSHRNGQIISCNGLAAGPTCSTNCPGGNYRPVTRNCICQCSQTVNRTRQGFGG